MKWKVRKNTTASLAAVAVSLLALICSVLSLRLTPSLLWLGLPSFHGVVPALCSAIPILTAVLLLSVCIAFHHGASHRLLMLAGFGMLLASAARFAGLAYDALYVRSVSFYPFSAEHMDVVYALILALVVVLTVCRAIRIPAWNVIAAVLLTVVYLTACITGLGVYTTPYVLDISGMTSFASYAICIALCSTALERVRETQAPVKQPVYPDEALMGSDWEIQNTIALEKSGDAPETELPPDEPEASVPNNIAPEETMAATEKTAAMAAHQNPVPPQRAMLPAPQAGCVWQWIGSEPDGTFIYQQRRVMEDRRTGEKIPGPMLSIFYPYPPRYAPPPAKG